MMSRLGLLVVGWMGKCMEEEETLTGEEGGKYVIHWGLERLVTWLEIFDD